MFAFKSTSGHRSSDSPNKISSTQSKRRREAPATVDPAETDPTTRPSLPAAMRGGLRYGRPGTSKSLDSVERDEYVDRVGSNRAIWFVCAIIYAALLIGALSGEAPFGQSHYKLLLFFTGVAMLAVLLPATGPRGQRLFILPGMGVAAMLLLPPLTAGLPILLANGMYAANGESSTARRISLLRGTWLLLASLLGGMAFRVHSDMHRPTISDAVIGVIFYCAVYVIGRRTDIIGIRRDTGGARMRAWYHLECITLAATTPAAVLMFVCYGRDAMLGAAMAGALFGLLVGMVHFGSEIKMLREQVRAMERISAVTLAQTNPKKVVERFIGLAGKLIMCDRSTLWLTDASQTRLEIVARYPHLDVCPTVVPDPVEAAVRFGEGLVGRVADHQNPMIVKDGAGDPRYSVAEEQNRCGTPFSVLLLPLVVGGETVGVAQFERDTPQSYNQRDLARIQSLTSQVASTIANVRMHQDIYAQAVTDGLTGLYNRRHIQTMLADERRRAERYGHYLSIVMLDVDGFKVYNDTYGHPQGDVLLKGLAEILRDNVRSVDFLGRYGGEEFIIIMPETSKAEAYHTSERLRMAVAATTFPGYPLESAEDANTDDDQKHYVHKTISLGIATYPTDTDDAMTLVAKADQALYRAKNSGRNQTIVAGAPIVRSEIAA